MPMMHIRLVRMCMFDVVMSVWMSMHGSLDDRLGMRVVMMQIGMAVSVGMTHGGVPVHVVMLFARQKRRGKNHQRQSGKERPLRKLRENRER